ncbi:MAG: hypothetical protein OXE59_12995 [Bacteroidetes bacterium]|nr:hypothetical protein [Bacteroidota bacterium]
MRGKRHEKKQAEITVWPAIADLMTAILVFAFLTGMVTMTYNYSPQSETGSISTLTREKNIHNTSR